MREDRLGRARRGGDGRVGIALLEAFDRTADGRADVDIAAFDLNVVEGALDVPGPVGPVDELVCRVEQRGEMGDARVGDGRFEEVTVADDEVRLVADVVPEHSIEHVEPLFAQHPLGHVVEGEQPADEQVAGAVHRLGFDGEVALASAVVLQEELARLVGLGDRRQVLVDGRQSAADRVGDIEHLVCGLVGLGDASLGIEDDDAGGHALDDRVGRDRRRDGQDGEQSVTEQGRAERDHRDGERDGPGVQSVDQTDVEQRRDRSEPGHGHPDEHGTGAAPVELWDADREPKEDGRTEEHHQVDVADRRPVGGPVGEFPRRQARTRRLERFDGPEPPVEVVGEDEEERDEGLDREQADQPTGETVVSPRVPEGEQQPRWRDEQDSDPLDVRQQDVGLQVGRRDAESVDARPAGDSKRHPGERERPGYRTLSEGVRRERDHHGGDGEQHRREWICEEHRSWTDSLDSCRCEDISVRLLGSICRSDDSSRERAEHGQGDAECDR
ncbi:hypothetical protein N6C22_11730 [Haloarchaeobius sp. HME9146]|nr:hypothetical protein [Haloarchaeobius sp. HME9146]MCT9096691.1 hypothetical protein [Haloarchaeobius sp. HME9146]